jgi:rhodanese-related sulfurtransferase
MIDGTRSRRNIMPVTAKQLLEAANAAVPKISGKEAQEMVAKGALLVDVRDGTEVAATGKAVGAVHIPRGLLEFKADPTAPTADKNFSTDKTVILHCASGGRAALAGKLLKDMGYEKVFNLGGLKDWVEAGGKVEKA